MLAKGTNTRNSNKAKKYRKDAKEKVDIYEEKKNDPKYKTELCKSFNETGFCPYGNKCRFAHGKDELFQKENIPSNYKKKKCISFHSDFYCVYGNRCLFKHQLDFKDIIRSYYYTLMILHKIKYLKEKDFRLKYGNSNILYIRTKRLKVFEQIGKNGIVNHNNISDHSKPLCNPYFPAMQSSVTNLKIKKNMIPFGELKTSDYNTDNYSSDENMENSRVPDDIDSKPVC